MNCPGCGIELDEHIKSEQAQKATEREQKEKELKNLFEWRCRNSADEFGASIKKAKIGGGITGFILWLVMLLTTYLFSPNFGPVNLLGIWIVCVLISAIFYNRYGKNKKALLYIEFKQQHGL